MSAPRPPNSCPHCSGTSGFFTVQTRKVTRLYQWDGTGSQDADDLEVVREGAPHCLDCQAPLPRKLLREGAK